VLIRKDTGVAYTVGYTYDDFIPKIQQAIELSLRHSLSFPQRISIPFLSLREAI
jgi:hypothetical protein